MHWIDVDFGAMSIGKAEYVQICIILPSCKSRSFEHGIVTANRGHLLDLACLHGVEIIFTSLLWYYGCKLRVVIFLPTKEAYSRRVLKYSALDLLEVLNIDVSPDNHSTNCNNKNGC